LVEIALRDVQFIGRILSLTFKAHVHSVMHGKL